MENHLDREGRCMLDIGADLPVCVRALVYTPWCTRKRVVAWLRSLRVSCAQALICARMEAGMRACMCCAWLCSAQSAVRVRARGARVRTI